jgi:23S rRNA (pseudouridine1915-N3)-methyltransferase
MKLGVIAIGRPGRGPDAAMPADNPERANLGGRTLGLGPVEQIDGEPRKAG